jgi:hypothetical protein
MSSNHRHIDISRTNYEDYFLLYVDGELSPGECDAVEAFAAVHPDLQEELDILLSTRLNAEPVVFLDKSSLMADSMKLTAIDESLLSYIDGELTGEEKAGLEWEMEKNPDLQAQHQLLLKTKLDHSEKIVYPHKEELYRHTERTVRPMFWVRAAAIVILVGWGAFWYMDNYGGEQNGEGMATNTQAVNTRPAATPVINNPEPLVSTPERVIAPSSTETSTETYIPAAEQSMATVDRSSKAADRPLYTEPIANPVVNPKDVTNDVVAVSAPPRVENITTEPQQIINNPTVTLQPDGTYNTIDVPTGEGSRGTTAVVDNDKKGSMRGFLRKTTRFIERRTGIDPTNEGDELMIGALTINLK